MKFINGIAQLCGVNSTPEQRKMLLWIFAGVILLFAIPVSYFFIWKPKTKDKKSEKEGKSENNILGKLFAQSFVLLYTFYIGVMGFCLAVKFGSGEFKQNKEREIKEKSESYTLYVDGVQVDRGKVNIGSYSVVKAKINDEEREIYFSTGKED